MEWVFTLISCAAGFIALLFSIWAIVERKRLKIQMEMSQSHRDNLTQLIEDANQMVEEMNNLSDYIVTQLDLKNKELWDSMKKFEEKMSDTSLRVKELNDEMDLLSNRIEYAQTYVKKIEDFKTNKVIPMNRRYNEAIELARKGHDVTEIAKKLNMGKGEIQLVLGLNQII